MITLDRVKGNPNRVAKMELRKYDGVTSAVIMGSEVIRFLIKEKVEKEQVRVNSLSRGEIEVFLSGTDMESADIEIYDVTGRRIKREIFEDLKSGYNEISLNANELSGGVYFYRLNTKANQYKGKIILIK